LERTGHPVRSAIHKLQIGGLVVGSVMTSEYPLLYVFVTFFDVRITFCTSWEVHLPADVELFA
jgi:hypothetical protein